MGFRWIAVFGLLACLVEPPTAPGDEKQPPKKPTNETDVSRLLGEWELGSGQRGQANLIYPKVVGVSYRIEFKKGGEGMFKDYSNVATYSYASFRWKVIDWEGLPNRVIVARGGQDDKQGISEHGTVIQFRVNATGSLQFFSGVAIPDKRLRGDWDRVTPEGK